MKNVLVLILTFCSAFLFSQTQLSKKDSNFVRMAADHTELEIKLAQLAQASASAPEVKTLASELLSYHSKALGELKMLAGKKNITLNTSLSERSQKYYDKFTKKQGSDFDKAYTKCAVKSHKGGSCALKKEAKKAKDPEIAAYASANYPALQQLSEKAKQTCKALKNKK